MTFPGFQSTKKRAMLRLLMAAVLLVLPVAAQADHCHSTHAADDSQPANPEVESLSSMNVPDVNLIDQDGNEVRFYSDLVRDRVVAMNFIFTTCTTICPPMGANFSKLQKLLGEDTPVQMISVSVDPVVDTPRRLESWGDKFGRAPGWTLLTGSKTEVDRLLKSLQVFTPDKTDHSPIVLLGNAASGQWTRTYGLTAPAQLVEMIDELAAPRLAAAGKTQEGP